MRAPLTKVSALSPVFNGGYQSLMDFNPMVNAIRLIDSEQQNYAVVKGATGILNTTAVQTSLTYPAPDVNAGKDPNIACGAYTNNVAGATVTIFYMIDHALDTFVYDPAGRCWWPLCHGRRSTADHWQPRHANRRTGQLRSDGRLRRLH